MAFYPGFFEHTLVAQIFFGFVVVLSDVNLCFLAIVAARMQGSSFLFFFFLPLSFIHISFSSRSRDVYKLRMIRKRQSEKSESAKKSSPNSSATQPSPAPARSEKQGDDRMSEFLEVAGKNSETV